MFDSQVLAFTVVAAALTVAPGADTTLVIREALLIRLGLRLAMEQQ